MPSFCWPLCLSASSSATLSARAFPTAVAEPHNALGSSSGPFTALPLVGPDFLLFPHWQTCGKSCNRLLYLGKLSTSGGARSTVYCLETDGSLASRTRQQIASGVASRACLVAFIRCGRSRPACLRSSFRIMALSVNARSSCRVLRHILARVAHCRQTVAFQFPLQDVSLVRSTLKARLFSWRRRLRMINWQ